MNDNVHKLSDYIDRLNAEQKPAENEFSTESEELKELYAAVRAVRSLKEPAMPGPGFQQKLIRSVAVQTASPKRPARFGKWGWIASAAGVAAVIALWINILLPAGNTDMARAMEQAFRDVNAYHGTLEVTETNADGESVKQAKWEVWADKAGNYYSKGLEGSYAGLVTVNNGQRKWQIQQEEKQVHLFPALPDAYRFQFELGYEIQDVRNALSVKEVGEEDVAGRTAVILEVTPDGGLPYRIWMDRETKLPLQKQTAMYHAIQYTMTYTQIEFAGAIPESYLAYELPKGYEEVDTNAEQFVADLEEAQEAAGFEALMPEDVPAGYVLDRIAIVPGQKRLKLYYAAQNSSNQIVLEQVRASGELKPAPQATVGKWKGGTVELQQQAAGNTGIGSVKWQQDGLELSVWGDAPLSSLTAFAESVMNGPIEMPSTDEPGTKPQVDVPYDLAVEANDQKSVDAGSSPWRLDPVFTAQVFVSLQMSPEGITGDYPIAEEALEVVANNGKDAVIQVKEDSAPSARVYLKRLVRQDSTGIWTVVGYDPR